MEQMSQWYTQLEQVKQYLLVKDPVLKSVFDTVDQSGFQLHTVVKDPYTALIGAIIGQKISYQNAKRLRSQLYARYGNILIPTQIQNADLSFLGSVPAQIITNVTNYIILNNIDLNTEEGIRLLEIVNGIGPWTIETTLLVCLKHWDIFPAGDKFIQERMRRLYGSLDKSNMITITSNWAPFRSVVTWYLWRWF